MLTYQVPETIRAAALDLVDTLDDTANAPEEHYDADEYCAAEDAVIDWVRDLAADTSAPARIRADACALIEELDATGAEVDDYCGAEDALLYWVRDLAGLRSNFLIAA